MSTILDVKNLKTWFPIRRGVLSTVHGYVKAVDDVSLSIDRGETLGLVGESGCGKTTLGRTIVGLERPTAGSIFFDGQDIQDPEAARSTGCKIQIIFQDPYSSLNPRMTIVDIITEGMVDHGMIRAADRESEARRLMQDVGLGENALHRFPHEFSGGQRQRICIARALSMSPEFIVCDEAVSALDVSVQAQVLNLLMDIREKYDLSLLFISHDLSVVKHISDRIAVMYLGHIVEVGPTQSLMENPLHPYTKVLIDSIPIPGQERKERTLLSGEIPSASNKPPGCPFQTRCPQVMDKCRVSFPDEHMAEGRNVCCHLFDQDPEEIDFR